MILSLILTAGLVATPPSPRAQQERQQTIQRRHARHQARAAYNEPWEVWPVYYEAWPVCVPPCAGQLPPYWDECYGAFFERMSAATR